MPAGSLSAEVDTAGLEASLRTFVGELVDRGPRVAMAEATTVANAIRAGVPRRSGRLAGTVRPVLEADGAGVAYGGGLPYAAYIERRTHAVARAVDPAAGRFRSACERAANDAAGRV